LYSFISESNAIAKAQVIALGGNALICHSISSQDCGGVYRNQGYSIVSIAGDAVVIEADEATEQVSPRVTSVDAGNISVNDSSSHYSYSAQGSSTGTGTATGGFLRSQEKGMNEV